MLSKSQREHIKSLVRTMQIIVLALAGSVVLFMVVVLVMQAGGQVAQQVPREPLISYAAIIFAFVSLALWVVVPRLIAGQMRLAIADGKPVNSSDGGAFVSEEMREIHPLIAMYQTTLILACAILEGAAFFNVVAFLLERQQMNFIAAGVLALLIFSQVPTGGRLVSWVEDELGNIDRLRSMRRT